MGRLLTKHPRPPPPLGGCEKEVCGSTGHCVAPCRTAGRTTAPPAHKAGPGGPLAKGSLGAHGSIGGAAVYGRAWAMGACSLRTLGRRRRGPSITWPPSAATSSALEWPPVQRGRPVRGMGASESCRRGPGRMDARGIYSTYSNHKTHPHPHHTFTIHTPHCSRIHVATS